jgi:predicted membrane-bound spermidine synthase
MVTGVAGFASHLSESRTSYPFPQDLIWALGVSALAVIAGVFMLRGAVWACWLAVAWLTFQVILSTFHSVRQTIAHAVLLAVIAYFLFRPEARDYFRGRWEAL